MHCTVSDWMTTKIEKTISAIKTLGKIDQAVLVFSGDLTSSCDEQEFHIAKRQIGKFLFELGNELNCGLVRSMVVPGNHDIILPKEGHDASTIIQWDKNARLNDELDLQANFFKYSTTKRCFKGDKLCDVKVLNFGNVKVQMCLLNSAPFSTRGPDDKQLHFFPSSIENKLIRDPEVDLKITVMHHHYEWCEWRTKEMIRRAIATDDFTFFGHDHKAEALNATYADGITYNIIMGGEFSVSLDKGTAFNVVIYDSETKEIERVEFNWAISEGIFIEKSRAKIAKRINGLVPSEEYLDKLLKDNQNIGSRFTEYYTFPKLTVEGEAFGNIEQSKNIQIDDIFSTLKKDKVIRITGYSGAGKTSLLRYLYWKSIDLHFVPLLIEKRDYRDNRIDKMFRDLFEDQYGNPSEHSYDAFLQIDNSSKIIFIDDVDLIQNSKARENLIANILDSGKLLIYTTKEINRDLEEVVKDKLLGKDIDTVFIEPTYKETRDCLIERIGKINSKSDDEIEAIKLSFDYMAQSQTSFFTFTPGNTLQYIKFFMQGSARDHKNAQSLSMVFETNIRTEIMTACKKDTVANVYLMVLEYIADQMYFQLRTETIDISQLSEMIGTYNSRKQADVNPKAFLKTCAEAHILYEESSSFNIGFYDKNSYAYFVAKSLNRQFEKDQTNLEKLNYVMSHICFGINDSIILFLSFIRSNTKIILKIAEDANTFVNDYPEWDFSEQNIPFLHEHINIHDKVPTSHERREAHEHLETVEKKRHEMIKFRGIFDFNEDDVNKTRFVIQRALKYAQLIGRALIDQYGALDREEIDRILDAIYVVPQKVIYAALLPYQNHCNEIVQSILAFAEERFPDDKITEAQIRELFAQAGTTLALNILNDIAYNSSNDSTINVLRQGPMNNPNHKIMCLMMEENVGNTQEFVSRAISLREDLGNIPYARMLISRIARKHIIYTANIDHRQIDRIISGNILSGSSKPSLLLDQGKKPKN